MVYHIFIPQYFFFMNAQKERFYWFAALHLFFTLGWMCCKLKSCLPVLEARAFASVFPDMRAALCDGDAATSGECVCGHFLYCKIFTQTESVPKWRKSFFPFHTRSHDGINDALADDKSLDNTAVFSVVYIWPTYFKLYL